MGIAIIVFITYALLSCLIISEIPKCLQNDCTKCTHTCGRSLFVCFSHSIMGDVKTPANNYLYSDKHAIVNRIRKNFKISIFEGRGAEKNFTIFHILVAAGPLSIGDIQRRLNKISGLEVTYYASLNKKIHALERGGYIGEVKPAAGCKAVRYEVRTKFYLAYYLNGKSREEILSMLNEPNAIIILSELINAEITET